MEKTKVIFKKVKDGYFQNDIIAFFIDNVRYDHKDRQFLVECYEHIGQHGEASESFMENDTILASVEEYEALKTELEKFIAVLMATIFIGKLKMVKVSGLQKSMSAVIEAEKCFPLPINRL